MARNQNSSRNAGADNDSAPPESAGGAAIDADPEARIAELEARVLLLEQRQGKFAGAIALCAKGLQALKAFRAGWTDKAAEAGKSAELLIGE